jgi:hypothetical protein
MRSKHVVEVTHTKSDNSLRAGQEVALSRVPTQIIHCPVQQDVEI